MSMSPMKQSVTIRPTNVMATPNQKSSLDPANKDKEVLGVIFGGWGISLIMQTRMTPSTAAGCSLAYFQDSAGKRFCIGEV